MSQNFATIRSITDNLESVCTKLGIKFARETFDDIDAIPASLLPHGQIFYEGEDFEYAFGQKPEYATANFRLQVVLKVGGDSRENIRNQQKWVHEIRDGLTVNALNITDLATTKYISMVKVEGVEAVNAVAKSSLNVKVAIKYREI